MKNMRNCVYTDIVRNTVHVLTLLLNFYLSYVFIEF